ncbi:distal tail protein Dit, partial [Sutcliffiella cohnii]
KDFRLEAAVEFLNTGGNKRGRVEIYLLDTQNRVIAKLALKDTWSIARAWGEARAGDNSDNHFIISESGESNYPWNDFRGILRIERIGNEWVAYISQVSTNGTHHSRRFTRWTDTEGKFTGNVAQVA